MQGALRADQGAAPLTPGLQNSLKQQCSPGAIIKLRFMNAGGPAGLIKGLQLR